jgi:hypothetical protein
MYLYEDKNKVEENIRYTFLYGIKTKIMPSGRKYSRSTVQHKRPVVPKGHISCAMLIILMRM